MCRSFNLASIILLAGIIQISAESAMAIDLDDLMGQEANSRPAEENDSGSGGVNIDDLMDSSGSAPGGAHGAPVDSGSLLGNVEEVRLSRKKNAAMAKYNELKKDISGHCDCLRFNNCDQNWSSGSWEKTGSFARKESKALNDKQQVCASANNNSINSRSSLENIKKVVASLDNSRQALRNIDHNMKSAVSNDKWEYRQRMKAEEERREEERALAKRRARERERARRDAEDEREQARAWAKSSSSSDTAFWNNINKIQNQTMNNIRANQDAHNRAQQEKRKREAQQRQASAASYQETIVRTCEQNGGRYNKYKKKCEPKHKPKPGNSSSYDAEKQNCLKAGKKWNNGCDYSSNVVIKGWSQGRTAVVQKSGSQRSVVSSTKGSGTATSSGAPGARSGTQHKRNQNKGNQNYVDNDQRNDKGHSLDSQKKSKKEKIEKKSKPTRHIPVFVQYENPYSWDTQESACKYARAAAKRKAEAKCRKDHKGRAARKSDNVGIPSDENCQSYRKTTFGWKTTGNIILQCVLPDL